MQKNTSFSDDLIGGGQEPIIIQQSGGSDKKFIYTVLILLVILFIAVLGAVIYFGNKFFATSNANIQTMQQQNITQNSALKKESQTAAPAKQTAVNTTQVTAQKEENVQIKNAVKKAASGVKLSPEDLEKIAKIVAEQLAQTKKELQVKKAQKSTTSHAKPAPKNAEEALVQSLQAAAADTLAQESVNIDDVDTEHVASSNNKKVDTFNKVVVQKEKANADDDFVKLSQEIDSILQTDDVQTLEKKEEKKLAHVIKTRKKELRFIVVRPGDTLGSIARRAYGRASAYTKLYEANPDLIKNPDKIFVGQKLRVPVDEEYQENAQ